MKNLDVYIEILGELIFVGEICGNSHLDASFSYSKEYLSRDEARPISVSLPLRSEQFLAEETKNFFEGLLPEGFSRRAVANWAKVSEEDYLSILEVLGRECIGALLIIKKGDKWNAGQYQKLSKNEVAGLAAGGATRSTEILMETHLSLAGASGKVGLYYDKNENEWYLPTGRLASTHIVKQSHVRLEKIVLNEYFCMLIAKKLGIEVPEISIIDIGNGKDEEVLFATKRYDRKSHENNEGNLIVSPYRLHQEDFAQALGIASANKYEYENKGYLRRMFELIRRVSSNPIEDQLKLWDMIVVNYLLGNTDCHLKNFSLLYGEDFKSIRLAPAYDIVCTTIYHTTNKMSFYIGGEIYIEDINRKSFLQAAKDVGLGRKYAMARFDELRELFPDAVVSTAKMLTERGYSGVDTVKEALLKRQEYIF